MESVPLTPIKTGPSYFVIGLAVVITIVIITIGYQIFNYNKIKNNWQKYRCDISVLPFASFYGQSADENFNYCMKNMMGSRVGAFLGPLAPIITSIVSGMIVIMNSINSIRLQFATLFTGIGMFFNEFSQRFNLVMNQIKVTGVRMQYLFNRLFSTFISIIFMGASGITAGMNFGDTALFGFLDLFCFDPVTLIDISGRGRIPVADVRLGDVCMDGSVIISLYRFYSRGQPMVRFGDGNGPDSILVSTNHYMKNAEDRWIRCEDHDDAVPAGTWDTAKPLVCFDTDTHRIPIGGYIFSDYDETNASDTATMKLIDSMINNVKPDELPNQYDWSYMPCLHPTTPIVLKDGTVKELREITIGSQLKSGTVIGVVVRHADQLIDYNGIYMTPSTNVWIADTAQWVRAGFLRQVHAMPEKTVMMMPIVLGSSTVEIDGGIVVRDLVEILSHDVEGPTAEAVLGCPKNSVVEEEVLQFDMEPTSI